MKPFPIWCNMCAKQNECHIADTVPKCYEPKQTEPSADIGTSDTVYSDTAGYMPRTDCGWK